MKERQLFTTPLEALLTIYSEYGKLEKKYESESSVEKLKEHLDLTEKVFKVKTNYETLLWLRSFFNDTFGPIMETYSIIGTKFYVEYISIEDVGVLNATAILRLPFDAWKVFEMFMTVEIFCDIEEDDPTYMKRGKMVTNFADLKEHIKTDFIKDVFHMIMEELLNNKLNDNEDQNDDETEGEDIMEFNSFEELIDYICNKGKSLFVSDDDEKKSDDKTASADDSEDVVIFDSMDTHHKKSDNQNPLDDKSKYEYTPYNEAIKKTVTKKNEGKETLASDYMGTTKNSNTESTSRLTADEARRMAISTSADKKKILNFILTDIDNEIKSAASNGNNRIYYSLEYVDIDDNYNELIDRIMLDLESRGFKAATITLFDIIVEW